VQDCSDSLKLHLSAHPLDFLTQNNEHDDHHHHTEEHENDDTQFMEVWQFAKQAKTFEYKNIKLAQIHIIYKKDIISHRDYNFENQPLKLPQNFIKRLSPDRAPPKLS
jgi:hypothetical protein